eukprot:743397-Alexandrium_andersonii.AAC.1
MRVYVISPRDNLECLRAPLHAPKQAIGLLLELHTPIQVELLEVERASKGNDCADLKHACRPRHRLVCRPGDAIHESACPDHAASHCRISQDPDATLQADRPTSRKQ